MRSSFYYKGKEKNFNCNQQVGGSIVVKKNMKETFGLEDDTNQNYNKHQAQNNINQNKIQNANKIGQIKQININQPVFEEDEFSIIEGENRTGDQVFEKFDKDFQNLQDLESTHQNL